MVKIKNFKITLFFGVFIFLTSASFVMASETNGTIDSTYKYVWGENIGWINFGCDTCNVNITDSAMTGYAWSENYGWINLNPSGSGVENNGEGVLSGQAWGENTGWIDFDGVTINSSGEFIGYANGDITGQISFNCSNTNSCSSSDFKLSTDWRPVSSRGTSLDTGNKGGYVSPPSVGVGDVSIGVDMGGVRSEVVIDTKGANFLVYIDSKIVFKIKGKNKKHTIKIKSLNIQKEKVELDLSFNKTKNVYLALNESELFDVDRDGYNDLKIKFNELKGNRIDLTLIKLNQNKKVFSDGDLVKEKNKPTVYLIENNKKRPILNEQIFNSYGFSWKNIIEADNINKYETGEILKEKTIKNKELNLNNIDYIFTRSLKLGDKGEDVKKLQIFLNNNGFLIAESGPGSPNNETAYFGNLTKKALIKFQNYYKKEILKPVGLSFGTGYFGQSTIKFINSFVNNIKNPIRKITTDVNIDKNVTENTIFTFTKYLELGMKNNDVKKLQEILSLYPEIYPEKLITGYFGILTKKAVQRFQLKHGVVRSSKDTGFGYVGPKTIKKLNEISKK